MFDRARRFRGRVTSSPDPYPPVQADLLAECSRRQADLSHRVTTFIDVLYGLVVVISAESYHQLVTDDKYLHIKRGLPVVLALVFVYFTTIQSFVDFHLSEEDRPYRLLNVNKRGVDLRRFYLDVVIVGFYSFLIFRCHVLLNAPAGDLTAVFVTVPVIFALYILWGWLRDGTIFGSAYSPWLLLSAMGLYVVLAMGYDLLFGSGWVKNAAFLATALVVMLAYRWLNWAQNRVCP